MWISFGPPISSCLYFGKQRLNSCQDLNWANDSRSDVIGCLSLDRPPRFAAPSYLWDQTSPSSISSTLSNILQALTDLSPKLADMCKVLESLTSVPRASRESRETFSLTIARSAHFLLLIPRGKPLGALSSPYSIISIVHETIRLAALRFLVTAAEHTHYTIGAAQYRKPQLSALIRKHETLWTSLEDLQLWILSVAAVTEESCDKAWLTDKMSLLMGKLGLKWSGLGIFLRQIAWVDDFDARLGKLEQNIRSWGRLAWILHLGLCLSDSINRADSGGLNYRNTILFSILVTLVPAN